MTEQVKSRRSDRRKAQMARKSKVRRVRIYRIPMILAVCAVIVVIAWLIVAKVTKPYRIGYQEAKEIADIQKQIADAKAENKRLKEDINYIKRPEGKMVEARKLGFVKEGEVSVIVEQPNRQQYELEKTKMPVVKETFFQSLKSKAHKFFSRF